MMYLFNNVYLTPDKTVNLRPEDDCGFVSQRMVGSSFHADNFFARLYNVHFKAPLFAVHSYEELLFKMFDGKEQGLFELFMQPRETRLVIMCDEESMYRITMQALKTMLPNATADTGWTIMKQFYLPYYYMHDSGLVSYIGPNDFQQVYMGLLAHQDTFKREWVKQTPWTLNARQRERLQQTAGVELQTATYMANAKWKFAREYKAKVVAFAKKALLQMLVNDLRQKLLDGFVDIGRLNPAFDPLDPTVLEKVAADPVYRFLVDPQFTPNNIDYVFNNYDMAALHTLFQQYAPLRAFNLNDFSLLAKENDLTFEDVLAHEMAAACGRRLLGADINYKNTVNIYLLDMIFDSCKNDPVALRQFSLEALPKR